MNDADYTKETWKAIPFATDYAVSDYGRVKRVRPNLRGNGAGEIRKTRLNKYGYQVISLTVNRTYVHHTVHTCVLTAFVGPKPSPTHHGAHGDGDRANNRLSNLRWATPKENQADTLIHGTRSMGSKHYSAKLTPDDVRDARELSDVYGLNPTELASLYGVNLKTMQYLVARKTWKHVC